MSFCLSVTSFPLLNMFLCRCLFPVSVYIFLSVCLCICVSLSLLFSPLSVFVVLSLRLSPSLCVFVCLCVSLSLSPVSLSLYLSVSLFVCYSASRVHSSAASQNTPSSAGKRQRETVEDEHEDDKAKERPVKGAQAQTQPPQGKQVEPDCDEDGRPYQLPDDESEVDKEEQELEFWGFLGGDYSKKNDGEASEEEEEEEEKKKKAALEKEVKPQSKQPPVQQPAPAKPKSTPAATAAPSAVTKSTSAATAAPSKVKKPTA
jgi:hypothetical protein